MEDEYNLNENQTDGRHLVVKDMDEHRRQYEALLTALPVGVFQTAADGQCVYINDRAIEIIGRPHEEILSAGWVNAIHPKDQQEVLASFAVCIEEQSIFKMEYRFLRPDESISWVVCQAVPYKGHNDKLWFLGTLHDITDRKQTEKALQASEQYDNLLIDGISDAVSLIEVIDELCFRYIRVNENFLKIFGLKEADIIGRQVEEVIPEGIARTWINDFNATVKSGEVFHLESNYGFGSFDVKIIPILRDDGRCTHLVASARDITEKKQMEEYVIRTQKLESLGLLAGGIAHDFNNILTAISGNVSLARMRLSKAAGERDNTVINLLGEAEKASLQAKDLTQQLLTFAKGGAPVVKTTSIGDLLKQTAIFALRGSNVQCRYLVPDDLWPVEIDKGQINQVIHNLIINADHAMPDGGEVIISAQNTVVGPEQGLPLEVGLYVKVAVKDHGIGISGEYLHKIFDPYFTTKQKCSGMGLATSYSIIDKHGGLITVESQPSSGTIFYMYLPASQNELVKRQLDSLDFTGKGRILIMDDEEILRQVIGEMLTFLGFRVSCARDGDEAIGLYVKAKEDGDPFDVVIMDLTIPGGMGGREAVQKLIEIDPAAKAVVASGYSNDPVMANFADYGFKAVVAKPFSIEELGEALDRMLLEPQKRGSEQCKVS